MRRRAWGGGVVTCEEKTNGCRLLMDTPEGKTPPARPVGKWEDNTEIEFWEVQWESVDWIHVAEDMERWRAVLNTVMKLLAGFITCRELLD